MIAAAVANWGLEKKDTAVAAAEYRSSENGATTVGAAVGKRAELFQGRCQLEATVSSDLVVQGGYGKIKLDSNSNIAVEGKIKASLLKNHKWNDSRMNLKSSTGLLFFPNKLDPSLSTVTLKLKAELESLFHTGKKGDQLGVAIQLITPGGKGLYQKVDDSDDIMRIAFRFYFGSKGR